jgi:ABC-type phosphate transport system permease subunit
MMPGACSSHVTIYIERIGLNEVAPEGTLREGIFPALFGTFLCFFLALSFSFSLSLSLMEHRTDVQAFRMQL